MENQTTSTLQELINSKAENRLKNDLKKLLSTLEDNRLLRGSYDYKPKLAVVAERDESDSPVKHYAPDSLDRLLNPNFGLLYKEMYENYLPIYIEQETKLFMEKVEKIQEDVNTLMDSQTYD